jgi:hypothetical protein
MTKFLGFNSQISPRNIQKRMHEPAKFELKNLIHLHIELQDKILRSLTQ